MEGCAVCGGSTERGEVWGQIVCQACADRPVLFAVSCDHCEWSKTIEGNERMRGQVKQRAQRIGNDHVTSEKLSDEGSDHAKTVWEMEHPDRESYVPDIEEPPARIEMPEVAE